MFSGVKELRKLDRHNYRGKRICINNSLNIDDTELHNLCNVSDLETGRTVRLRNYMFKNNKNCIINDNNINTRLHDGPVFKVIRPNSEPIKRCVKYAGALEWNNLDADVSNIDENIQFKRIQKAWMLNSFKILNIHCIVFVN